MVSESLVFTLLYVLIAVCFVIPPKEFISAGFTIQSLFPSQLGNESQEFIQYHLRRIGITAIVHSLLPLGYLFGLNFCDEYQSESWIWKAFVTVSCFLFTIVATTVYKWNEKDYKAHPVTKQLSLFCNPNTDWKNVASVINYEYRRIDIITIHTSSVVKIVVTENWIIKVEPYDLKIAHQSDSVLSVSSSDTHNIDPSGQGGVQYLNVDISGRTNFRIRLNSVDFRELQNKLLRPINILDNVSVHLSLSEKFLEVFKEQVALNAVYETSQELEQCVGCLQSMSNIKLTKQCNDTSSTNDSCNQCYCRPMWCLDCMGKWFASRQDKDHPESWLSSKCSCPLCRSKFCILDVSIVQKRDTVS